MLIDNNPFFVCVCDSNTLSGCKRGYLQHQNFFFFFFNFYKVEKMLQRFTENIPTRKSAFSAQRTEYSEMNEQLKQAKQKIHVGTRTVAKGGRAVAKSS